MDEPLHLLSSETENIPSLAQDIEASIEVLQSTVSDEPNVGKVITCNTEETSTLFRTSLSVSDTGGKSNAISDSIVEGIKRNDSYTMFGHMEIVSLDASEQESQSAQPQSSDPNNLTVDRSAEIIIQNRPVQMRSLSLDAQDQVRDELHVSSNLFEKTQSLTECQEESELSLSKYFSLPVDSSLTTDPGAQDFFDALSTVSPMMKSMSDLGIIQGSSASASAESVPVEVPVSSTIPVEVSKEVKFTIGDTVEDSEIKPEVAEEVLEDPMHISSRSKDGRGDSLNMHKKEVSGEQPSLSKFFSEDKGGGDAQRKTFFDIIGTERVKSHSFKDIPNPTDAFPTLNKNNGLNPAVAAATVIKDAFLMSLGSTDNDQMYDAWLPSEKTRQSLVAMVTSTPGSYFPEKDQLTMPGIIIEEDMVDPVKQLLSEVNSPEVQKRTTLTVNDVSEDQEGLKKLITADCYHAAINLTTRLLKAIGQGPGQGGHPSRHTPFSLQLWFTRLALFLKLGKFSLAEVESEAFGDLDKPDMYYEFYPDVYCGRKGSMVPFSFRLLLAELPQYQGNHQAALDNLYSLLTIAQKISQNLQQGLAEDGSMIELTEASRKASLELWEQRECRILYSVLNCVLSQRDYITAASVVDILMKKDREHVPQLYSALGRIFLQLGDMKAAQECFSNASVQRGNNKENKNVVQVEELINKALLAIAHNDSEEAYKFYKEAYALQPDNAMLANNIAVCLLYMGCLKDSLDLLENTVQKKPHDCLHDGILFNTCTLYELESSRSTLKKFAMLDLVSKHAGDNFHISCLKIQTPPKG